MRAIRVFKLIGSWLVQWYKLQPFIEDVWWFFQYFCQIARSTQFHRWPQDSALQIPSPSMNLKAGALQALRLTTLMTSLEAVVLNQIRISDKIWQDPIPWEPSNHFEPLNHDDCNHLILTPKHFFSTVTGFSGGTQVDDSGLLSKTKTVPKPSTSSLAGLDLGCQEVNLMRESSFASFYGRVFLVCLVFGAPFEACAKCSSHTRCWNVVFAWCNQQMLSCMTCVLQLGFLDQPKLRPKPFSSVERIYRQCNAWIGLRIWQPFPPFSIFFTQHSHIQDRTINWLKDELKDFISTFECNIMQHCISGRWFWQFVLPLRWCRMASTRALWWFSVCFLVLLWAFWVNYKKHVAKTSRWERRRKGFELKDSGNQSDMTRVCCGSSCSKVTKGCRR